MIRSDIGRRTGSIAEIIGGDLDRTVEGCVRDRYRIAVRNQFDHRVTTSIVMGGKYCANGEVGGSHNQLGTNVVTVPVRTSDGDHIRCNIGYRRGSVTADIGGHLDSTHIGGITDGHFVTAVACVPAHRITGTIVNSGQGRCRLVCGGRIDHKFGAYIKSVPFSQGHGNRYIVDRWNIMAAVVGSDGCGARVDRIINTDRV